MYVPVCFNPVPVTSIVVLDPVRGWGRHSRLGCCCSTCTAATEGSSHSSRLPSPCTSSPCLSSGLNLVAGPTAMLCTTERDSINEAHSIHTYMQAVRSWCDQRRQQRAENNSRQNRTRQEIEEDAVIALHSMMALCTSSRCARSRSYRGGAMIQCYGAYAVLVYGGKW